MTPSEKAAGRQYTRSIFIAGVIYVALLSITQTLIDRVGIESDLLRYVLAVIPVLPIVYGMNAYLRFLRNIDELQRRIQLDAIGFSVALTSIITFALGLLETAGLPPIGVIWVFPMLIALWGIGLAIANRRYN